MYANYTRNVRQLHRKCMAITPEMYSNYTKTDILLRLFQQHYVTGQSQGSDGSDKPAEIIEVHSKLHSVKSFLCTLTATHLTLIYVCTYIRLSVLLGCLVE